MILHFCSSSAYGLSVDSALICSQRRCKSKTLSVTGFTRLVSSEKLLQWLVLFWDIDSLNEEWQIFYALRKLKHNAYERFNYMKNSISSVMV